MKALQLIPLACLASAISAQANEAQICYTNHQGAVYLQQEVVLKCHGQPATATLREMTDQGYRVATLIDPGKRQDGSSRKLVILDRRN